MTKQRLIRLAACILGSLLAGALGSVFTFSAIPNWYVYLNKPFYTPPNWIFGPVWTLLYALMGIALFIVWEKNGKGKDFGRKKWEAYYFFLAQLLLNALWSVVFFGLKLPAIALFEIMVLWLMIVYTIVAFNRLSKVASWLLVPYLLWVTFATLLNAGIVFLN